MHAKILSSSSGATMPAPLSIDIPRPPWSCLPVHPPADLHVSQPGRDLAPLPGSECIGRPVKVGEENKKKGSGKGGGRLRAEDFIRAGGEREMQRISPVRSGGRQGEHKGLVSFFLRVNSLFRS